MPSKEYLKEYLLDKKKTGKLNLETLLFNVDADQEVIIEDVSNNESYQGNSKDGMLDNLDKRKHEVINIKVVDKNILLFQIADVSKG